MPNMLANLKNGKWLIVLLNVVLLLAALGFIINFFRAHVHLALAQEIPIKSQLGDEDFVTPETFGAVGDGQTDDTRALQNAINSGYPVVLLPKDYLISSSLIISGKKSITDLGSTIHYTGTDAAVRLTAINNLCNISFGCIVAENGSGIEFYCDSKQSRCQYINIRFDVIKASKYCIFFNRAGEGDTLESGWLNEIRISDGRFSGGEYGIYADAKEYNGINNIKFVNTAFEGVTIGAHIANGCRGWSFINVRIAEMVSEGQRTFETVGSMLGLNIITNDRYKAEKTSLSSETQGMVIAPIQGKDYNGNIVILGNAGEIIDGKLYSYNHSMSNLQHFETIKDNEDLDKIILPGNYCYKKEELGQSLMNTPFDGSFIMRVYYADGSSEYITQELQGLDNNLEYRRTFSKRNKSFSAWKRMLNEDDYNFLYDEINDLRMIIDGLLP